MQFRAKISYGVVLNLYANWVMSRPFLIWVSGNLGTTNQIGQCWGLPRLGASFLHHHGYLTPCLGPSNLIWLQDTTD